MRQPDNEKIAKIFDKEAARYDRQMGFFERFVLGSARAQPPALPFLMSEQQ
jgi:hypothetical protein